MSLEGRTILITGAARRIGRRLALAAAQAGADLVLHHGHSPVEAGSLQQEIQNLGRQAIVVQADLEDPAQVERLVEQANQPGQLFGLINNAAIFTSLDWNTTSRKTWDQHLSINLTAPFLLSQALARQIPATGEGRIVNLLDWRALRPGADHLPYTISKAGLAALTRSLAQALAPRILVNAIALGAILPPSDGAIKPDLLDDYPLRRWAELEEVEQTLLFLLDGPAYITGEIIHLDGGRHLV